MKKFFALLMCAAMLFSFTACLATPEQEVFTEDETTTKKTTDELPVSGIEGAYKFDEYSDHIVLTEYIGTNPSLYIPDKIKGKPVTEFGTIFRGQLNIKSVIVGKNCTEIVDKAFENCYNLQRLEISGGVKSIGESAFFGCHSLEVIYIPSCVEEIADDAFTYITGLTIIGEKGSAAERLAETYESIYFSEMSNAPAESTIVLVSDDYTEDVL